MMKKDIEEYFSRTQEGGAINSSGLAEQDCTSIVYLFRYLDNENFKAITFESLDDFTILFEDENELRIQVKNNFFTIKFIRKLLEKYESIEGRVFVGNGFDDDFRNLHSKLLKYKNAISIRENNKEEFLKVIKDLCNNHKIDFDKIEKIQFDSIDKIHSLDLAKYSIREWAEKKHLFVNTFGILAELQTKISLILREKRGFLTKKDVLDIIRNHRNSRIASNYYEDIKDTAITYVIQNLEQLMLEQPRISMDLQIVKYEIENKMYVEAFNHILDLNRLGLKNIDEIYRWLLFKNKDYTSVIEFEKKDSDFDRLILGRSFEGLHRYDEAITNLKQISNWENLFEIYFRLAKCYKRKGDKEKSIIYLKKCLNFKQYKEVIYFELGMMYPSSKKCIEYMDKALKCNEKFTLALLEKGKTLRYFGQFKKAIDSLEMYLELSEDRLNSKVLLEIAMSYYNSGETKNIYLSRWIDRFINFDLDKSINDGETKLLIDIGYEYSNILALTKNKDYIELNINSENIFKVQHNVRSKSAIGLYVSPTNRWMIKSVNDDDELDMKASLPALFKIYDDQKQYAKTKNTLLLENSLRLNHSWNGYEEYLVNDNDVKVTIIKKVSSLNAIVQIGNFIIDEWIPKTEKGFHNFRSKLQSELMFNEVAVVLIAPEEICQITFHKDRIQIIDKM